MNSSDAQGMSRTGETRIPLQRLREEAARLGFDAASAAPARTYPRADFLDLWLQNGWHGSMAYLEREPQRRKDPRQILPGAKAVVCVAKLYRTASPEALPADNPDLKGAAAAYACGDDYHNAMREPLERLQEWIRRQAGPETQTKPYIDTGPILERPAAALAGLGWIGKNTLLLNQTLGSYFFLAEIVTDADLETNRSVHLDRCGSCARCLDACPTDAFPEPYVMDASKCVSYLTIEHRGSVPKPLRSGIGNMIFGCDICQAVCPWNRKAPLADAPEFQPRAGLPNPKLDELIQLDDEAFRERFRNSPLKRAKRRGTLRNAAVALGNSRNPDAVPALAAALNDHEPLVRSHAAWALGNIGGDGAVRALLERRKEETDPDALNEIEQALSEARS